MMSGELLAKHGIHLESTAPGRYYTTCPQCSMDRTKPGHKNAKCLGVTITNDTARWGCNHCGWTGPEKGAGGMNGKGQGFAATYDYVDAAGKLWFQKVRNLPGREPRFWCRQPDGRGGWIKGLKGVDCRPLYREPEVLEAIANECEIAVVEGEKDADRLWSAGLPATCNFDGAADTTKNPKVKPKWRPEYSERLRGARLVVLNDNDTQGYAHADAVCRVSAGVAACVRRLDLALHWPNMPKGADVSDWLDQGNTREELNALISAAPDYISPQTAAEPGAGPAASDLDAEIERLARLSILDYERERVNAAEKTLGIRTSILDRVVKAERTKLGLDQGVVDKQGRAMSFPDVEPWPEPVNGAELLDGIAGAIRRHVVLADTACAAAALWIVHTYLLDVFSISPRLGVVSPTKRCGKTTLLDVLGCLVLRSLPAANVTAAAVFRVIEMYHPTLLVDEADTFLRDNDELRGVINSGHRKGGKVLRTVGEDHEPRAFSTYGACAVALIGTLPDTLHDRSVPIDLKRRLKTEQIEPFRCDRAGHLDVLARKAARWTADHAVRIGELDPELPAEIINREADNWRPLLAIADAAGGNWPDRARRAAEMAHGAGDEEGSSLVERLLSDIRATFAEKDIRAEDGEDKIKSAQLVEALVGIEGHPWAEMGKTRKPLTQNRLAKMLRPLDIIPDTIRIGDTTAKGYFAHRFRDAFARFCPEGGFEPSHRNNADGTRVSEAFQTVTDEGNVTVRKCEKSNNDGLCCGVAVQKGVSGEEREVCTQCGRAGGNEVYFSGGQTARLHRECEALYQRFLDEGHAPKGELEKPDTGAG
jgi:putative DNA primase/helicase